MDVFDKQIMKAVNSLTNAMNQSKLSMKQFVESDQFTSHLTLSAIESFNYRVSDDIKILIFKNFIKAKAETDYEIGDNAELFDTAFGNNLASVADNMSYSKLYNKMFPLN